MGLRTASVRRPYVEVMAPALTETTTQNQNFKLDTPTKEPIKQFTDNSKYLPDEALGLGLYKYLENDTKNNCIMSDCPTSMDEQILNKKMGLQQPKCHELDENIRKIHNDNNTKQSLNEVDQILSSLTSNMVTSTNDEDLMAMADLPTNIEKFLLNEVDSMMNISIEEQPDLEAIKEAQSKTIIEDLKQKQAKIDRRLDFLKRKIHKLQIRKMGEHVSNEVGGVFELVHRSLKRIKETSQAIPNSIEEPPFDNSSMLGEGIGLVPPLPTTPSTSGGEKADKSKPMSYSSAKTLLKKLEMATALQASSIGRQKHIPKYFGSGSCDPMVFLGAGVVNAAATASGSGGRSAGSGANVNLMNVPGWTLENKHELEKVTGLLHTELAVVQHEIDSEATESSSGGESCDEMQSYNNPHQQYLAIQKRALWKYASSRAAIAAKWTWLQAQISYLEYRIRQHTDLHRQIRASKGDVLLGGPDPPPPTSIAQQQSAAAQSQNINSAVNGYRGQLPGQLPGQQQAFASTTPTKCDEASDVNSGATSTKNHSASCNNNNNSQQIDYQCARTRPLINLKKRKLLQINGLHIISKKAARPSNIRCGCDFDVNCAICTGRTDPTYPRDPSEALSKAERIAMVDPGFHPVFSMSDDVSYGLHCDAIMKTTDWQQRSTRMKSLKVIKNDRSEKSGGIMEHRTKKLDHRKKFNRGLLKPSTVSALSNKIKNKIRSRKLSRSSTFRKRSTSKSLLSSHLHSLSGTDNIDDELESIGYSIGAGASNSAICSPSSSPLLHMQAISGYNRRNRANSYDIDNIVIPYSVAASTRVEKLQYKEILTPKWRIAETDFKCDNPKNNGVVKITSQDSDAEDLAEEAVRIRHDRSEHDEKKKFLSYLKLPLGHRSRANKRTDSLAESSGNNTPDPLSPQPLNQLDLTIASTSEPQSPPPPMPMGEELVCQAQRRRTISQSRFVKDKETLGANREEFGLPQQSLVESYIEIVPPYDTRTFPIDEDVYDKMLKNMPENHQQFQTNIRAQDSNNLDVESTNSDLGYLDEKLASPGSESTESALGEEDPNDPEWIDMERNSKDRHKR